MRFESGNVPRELDDAAHKVATIRGVAFTPKGGWVLVSDGAKAYSDGVGQQLLTVLSNQHAKGAVISCVAIGDKGDQVVLCTDSQSVARGITADQRDWIDLWNGGTRTVNWAEFDGAGWVIIGSDGEIRSDDINDNCLQAMYNLSQTAPIDVVAFDSAGGWVVAAGPHIDSDGVDEGCLTVLRSVVDDGDGLDGVTFGADPGAWAAWSNHTTSPATDLMRQVETELNLRVAMKDRPTPGVAIAIVEDGEMTHHCGYGWLKQGGTEAVHPDSLFQAASVSKTVNALGILKLVDTGVIALDDSIRPALNWDLPDTTGAVADHEITYRQLLSHTGGTSTHGFAGYPSGSTLPTILETLDDSGPANNLPVQLFKDPGAQYDYSGGGTTMLQRAVEELTGETYAQWMHTNVLMPLSMRSSTFELGAPSAGSAGVAAGHLNGLPIVGDRNDYPESAAAGLYTSVVDLCSVVQVINNGGQHNGQFVAEELIDEMLTPILSGSGLGCFIGTRNGRTTWAHDGSNEGFRSQIYGIPDLGAGVVIMVNSEKFGLRNLIFNTIKDVFGW